MQWQLAQYHITLITSWICSIIEITLYGLLLIGGQSGCISACLSLVGSLSVVRHTILR